MERNATASLPSNGNLQVFASAYSVGKDMGAKLGRPPPFLRDCPCAFDALEAHVLTPADRQLVEKELPMFSLFKPAHVALRNMLSPAVAREYDEVLGMFIDTIPSEWSKQTRDRTITLVMAEWVTANADAGRIQIHAYAYKKAEHFYDVCLKFNDRDPQNGSMSTWMASDLRRALREEDIIPVNS